MKNITAFAAMLLCTPLVFAQGMPVSASAVADDVSSPNVSATATAQDVSAPYVAAMGCCTVSAPVSAAYDGRVSSPQTAKAEDNSGALSMAGLGFGLVGLVGVAKLARRKKQK